MKYKAALFTLTISLGIGTSYAEPIKNKLHKVCPKFSADTKSFIRFQKIVHKAVSSNTVDREGKRYSFEYKGREWFLRKDFGKEISENFTNYYGVPKSVKKNHSTETVDNNNMRTLVRCHYTVTLLPLAGFSPPEEDYDLDFWITTVLQPEPGLKH